MSRDANSALEAITNLVVEWERSNTDKMARHGQYDMWGYNDYDLDYRDLILLLAAAQKTPNTFLVKAEAAVEGWRAANRNQRNIINHQLTWRKKVVVQIRKVNEVLLSMEVDNADSYFRTVEEMETLMEAISNDE